MRFVGTLVMLTCVQAAAQTPSELLAQIRRRMTENLSRLPNYTCRETIERTIRQPDSKHYRLLDRLRLDVAYVGGKELYAWPGAEKFEDVSIGDIVEGGAIGNGTFGGFAHEVFSTMAAKFFWGGELVRNGRKMVHFDFRVPLEKSRYSLQSGETRERVAYRGYFEADRDTSLPFRLVVEADAIPPDVKLRVAGQSMQYGEMRIGDSQFLLPVSSELRMEQSNGAESLNAARFESCRQYSGDSTLRFDVVDDEGASAPKPAPIEIPAGLNIDIRLAAPISYETAARGDIVHAVVASDVKRSSRVVVPKGAVVAGRITAVATDTVRSSVYLEVGLKFESIQFDGRRGTLSGELDSAGVGANFSVWGGKVVRLKGPTAAIPEQTRLLLRTK